MGRTTEIGIGRIEVQELDKLAARSAPPLRNNKKGAKPWKKVLWLSLGAAVLVGLIVGGIIWGKRGVVTVQTGKVLKQDLASVVSASGEIPTADG